MVILLKEDLRGTFVKTTLGAGELGGDLRDANR